MKILGINDNPIIRAYTHEVFVHAIASNKDNTGNKLAEVRIISANDKPFTTNTTNSEIRIKENIIEQYSDIYEKQAESYVYRNCGECDELTIKIEYQQEARPWAIIYLFVNNLKDINNQENFNFRFGKFCNQTLLIDDSNDKNFVDYKHNPSYPYWLKLNVMNDKIYSYISFDGTNWIETYKGDIKYNKQEQRIIGVCFDLQNNNYYNWLFSNHVQLSANKESMIAIDYLISPYKNYMPYTYNPLINFIPERREVVEKQFLNIMEFVKTNIDCNRYVEMCLDEFYISTRDSYQKRHFNHTNLVYGYDDTCVYILGITQGKPLSSRIKKEDFIIAYEACKDTINVIFLFDYLAETYDFNIEQLIVTINDYLSGVSGRMRFYNIPSYENNSYGINVYNEFIEDKGLDIIIKDPRVSYVLLEHKLCMRERIRFLVKRGYISEEDYITIISDMNELCKNATLLLHLIIKNQKKNNCKVYEKVKGCLMELKNIELHIYSVLIKLLTR